MNVKPPVRKHLLGASLGALLAISLAACAPEPGTEAGSTDKDSQTINPETSWGDGAVPDEGVQTELPESFPSDAFALPEGAVIENTGERGTGQWFLVLRADDEAEAERLWDAVIAQNGFTLEDSGEAVEGGRFGTLRSVSLTVQALTIPQQDGSVQLSYDLASTIG